MIGAVAAGSWANGGTPFQDRALYNDTDEFYTFQQAELWSWVGGGILMAGGVTGLIFDGIRVPPQADKPPPDAIPAPIRPEAPPPPSDPKAPGNKEKAAGAAGDLS
jgi:hypothetical protein